MAIFVDKAIQLIDRQIEFVRWQIQLEQTCPFAGQVKSRLQWTGNQMDFVELFYALHGAKCFGSIKLKDMFAAIGEIFGCKVKNHYRLFWDIKNRVKGDRTAFLDRLKKSLITKMEEADE